MVGVGLPESVSAVLFDLDGVLTDTAAVHRRAWKSVFDRLLASRCGARFRPFTEEDYLNYVDGRSRADGVREFLKSRTLALPEGKPDDPPGLATVNGIGNDKNRLLLSLIERDGVRVFPGSAGYLTAVRAAGLRVGVVTSSANATAVLAAADFTRFVDALIDGREIARRGLPGKPAPDAFLAGAAELDEPPSAQRFSKTPSPESPPPAPVDSASWWVSTGCATTSTAPHCAAPERIWWSPTCPS